VRDGGCEVVAGCGEGKGKKRGSCGREEEGRSVRTRDWEGWVWLFNSHPSVIGGGKNCRFAFPFLYVPSKFIIRRTFERPWKWIFRIRLGSFSPLPSFLRKLQELLAIACTECSLHPVLNRKSLPVLEVHYSNLAQNFRYLSSSSEVWSRSGFESLVDIQSHWYIADRQDLRKGKSSSRAATHSIPNCARYFGVCSIMGNTRLILLHRSPASFHFLYHGAILSSYSMSKTGSGFPQKTWDILPSW
jgi:hypothetical protein